MNYTIERVGLWWYVWCNGEPIDKFALRISAVNFVEELKRIDQNVAGKSHGTQENPSNAHSDRS